MSRVATLAPAFQSRDFRLFWLGQLVSTVGTSLQVLAEGWLIYDVTQSTFWLGAVGFIGLLPVLPVSLLGGVLIDRLPRRRLIMFTQAGLLLQAVIFATLAMLDLLQLWHLIVLYFAFGALLAIDHPARRAFVVDLVSADTLANAVALNATLFNVSQLIGFAAGGLLLATVGPGPTMLLNALTYIVPIVALSRIRAADVRQDDRAQKLSAATVEGMRALLSTPSLLYVIGIMALVGGLVYPVVGLMPAFAETVVGTGEIGLGTLLAAGAFGSLIGTGLTGILGRGRHGAPRRGRALLLTALALPLLVAGVASSRTLVVACILVAAAGAGLLVLQSLAITLVQVNIADRVRGRVMTLYSIIHAGADTGSNLLIGALATQTGLPVALMAGAGAALLGAIVVALIGRTVWQLE